MYLFASGGIEVATKHGLPQTIDSKWVFADEHSGALLHRVVRAALSDARNARIRFDQHYIRTLIEERLFEIWPAGGIRGGLVITNPGNLRFRQTRCIHHCACSQGACRANEAIEERSSFHLHCHPTLRLGVSSGSFSSG